MLKEPITNLGDMIFFCIAFIIVWTLFLLGYGIEAAACRVDKLIRG